jgi:putative selenate reductase
MSDHFFPIPIKQLLEICFSELEHKDSFFGIPSELFFRPETEAERTLLRSTVFGKHIDTPIGVAAGPHSQMAQNIIAAWIMGARFIELKTIQTLDELDVAKPCIDMQDEGYNCEWSQELKIEQSFHEYLNAWIGIHVLNHKLGFAANPGLIFNMSVGYNLEGIMKPNVQWFFEKMKDCRTELATKIEEIRSLYPNIDQVKIPERMSDNITLSTMHGCPASEIAAIGEYLLSEKQLHTYIKLNPTLLGAGRLRDILNTKAAFHTKVPDEAFAHDLTYEDAKKMIARLQLLADKNNLEFGLKLTNTLESQNHKQMFDKEVESMYMSGRALHPISVSVAHVLQQEFAGRLSLSFSGGADAFNVADLLACGFKTVSVCTDLLKPGGYMRLAQYMEQIREKMKGLKAGDIESFIVQTSGLDKTSGAHSRQQAIVKNLEAYTEHVLKNPAYKRVDLISPDIKTSRELGVFDCISAPCRDTCATRQDIPEYLYYTAQRDFDRAFRVILRTNPFPSITGMVCDHLCQNKCTRVHYDGSLLIREVKRFISGQQEPSPDPLPAKRHKVAVIGAGPAGLSCAYFLALAGCEVDVYESRSKAGGMVRFAIPGFRLTDEAVEKDFKRVTDLGVRLHYNAEVDKDFFEEIKKKADFVFVGVGAQLSAPLHIEGMQAKGVLDSLQFLYGAKKGEQTGIGQHVVIIGGGNTAMDAARTAYRLTGEKGTVSVVYRRTINEMPADQGEIKAVLEEGIQIIELAGPEKVIVENEHVRALRCFRMELKEADDSGRPRPVRMKGSGFDIPCDTIIPAVGQVTDIGFAREELLKADTQNYLSKIDHVFIGGDALRGASTAINAIGDGRKAAESILKQAQTEYHVPLPANGKAHTQRDLMIRRGKRVFPDYLPSLPLTERKSFKLVQQTMEEESIVKEAARCLHCDELCSICTTVCPNFANFAYQTEPHSYALQRIVRGKGKKAQFQDEGVFELRQSVQILNIANFCNECGNCHTFCPTSDAPYRVKPKLHLSIESFYGSEEGYYLSCLPKQVNLIAKKEDQLATLSDTGREYVYETSEAVVYIRKDGFSIRKVTFFSPDACEISLWQAAEMRVIMQGAREYVGR